MGKKKHKQRESFINEDFLLPNKQARKLYHRFAADLPGDLQHLAEQSFIDEHPEPMLLAYVMHEVKTWMQRPEVRRAELEHDKFLMLAAINTVQCIAYGTVLDPA